RRSVHQANLVKIRACLAAGHYRPEHKKTDSPSYGDSASLHLPPGTDLQIADFVKSKCGGKTQGLKFVVQTTLHEFEAPIHENLLTLSV
ncbi:hypothetical protein ACQKO7_19050, partial [Pseudomonas putida]|uniref:hypothetical protein n=1 Tax=Pseudomonas putida TaxID=303 RepID=UPI003CFE24D2